MAGECLSTSAHRQCAFYTRTHGEKYNRDVLYSVECVPKANVHQVHKMQSLKQALHLSFGANIAAFCEHYKLHSPLQIGVHGETHAHIHSLTGRNLVTTYTFRTLVYEPIMQGKSPMQPQA
eukprot:scaffold114880_cov16-Tisochrysis_lutea.AAC.2